MIRGFFENIPTLKAMTKKIGSDSITLKNRVVIKVSTNSYRSVRGRGILVAILDEACFFRSDDGGIGSGSANPDTEVVAALAPGLARVPNSMMIMISSVYKRSGVVYERWKNHYGKNDDDILIIKGSTTQFNPTFPQSTIDRALELDRSRYAAEYLSVWRDDLQNLVAREVVEACVEPGIYERPPARDTHYFGFCDPSGGSADSMTLAIGHMPYAAETVVIDCLREARPPFSPEVVVKEFSETFKSYGITTVIGDRYAGEWPIEQFAKLGIRYEPSAKPKSELYIGLLPLINSCRVELLDDRRCIAQICSLERRTARGGRDSIDHPPQQHDDLANAVAGVVSISIHKYGNYDQSMNWVDGTADEKDRRSYAAERLSSWLFAHGIPH